MKKYELTAILREGSHTLIEETKTIIKDILKRYSADISGEEDWGSKKLYHRIKGLDTGFFTHFKCSASPEAIAKIKHEMLLNQDILRYLIVKL